MPHQRRVQWTVRVENTSTLRSGGTVLRLSDCHTALMKLTPACYILLLDRDSSDLRLARRCSDLPSCWKAFTWREPDACVIQLSSGQRRLLHSRAAACLWPVLPFVLPAHFVGALASCQYFLTCEQHVHGSQLLPFGDLLGFDMFGIRKDKRKTGVVQMPRGPPVTEL